MRKSKEVHPELYNALIEGLFFCIYWVVRFFVFVGEIISGIFRIPGDFLRIFAPRQNSRSIYQWRISGYSLKLITGTLFKLIVGFSDILFKIFLWLFKIITAPFRLISIKIKYFTVGFTVCLVLVFLNQAYVFVNSLPSPTIIGKVNYALSSHIYDRNGKLLYEIYRNQNRTPVELKDLPPYIYQASIAIEDKDFYRHNGVSLFSGILRAVKDMAIKKQLQGGSTITQQLVKSSLLTPERTIQRKVKEIILALWAERIYGKDQILEMYVNQVP